MYIQVKKVMYERLIRKSMLCSKEGYVLIRKSMLCTSK